MAAPSAITLANFPLKLGLGKGNTSNNYLVNQETIVSSFIAATQNIWSQEISATPPAPTATDGVVSKQLILDIEQIAGTYAYRLKLPAGQVANLTGSINPFTGSAYQTGDFVGHVITERFGADYFPVIKNSSGTQISKTNESNWVFDPFAGVITQENSLFALNGGTVTCRIYVGKFLNETLSDFDNVVIAGGGIPQSVIDNLQTQINSLSGDVVSLEQLFGGGYATFAQLVSVSGALDTLIQTNINDIGTIQSDIVDLQADIASITTLSGAVTLGQINNLQSQIDTLSGGLQTTNDNLEILNTNFGNFQSQTSSDFSSVNDDIASNLSLIQQLSASSGSSSSSIVSISAAVDSQIANLQAQISSNDIDIADLQADLLSITTISGAVTLGQINALQSQINAISADQVTTTSSISAAQNDINDINNSLVGISNNQSQFSSDISNLQTDVTTNLSLIYELSGSSASNEYTLSQIQALSGELKGDISGLQSQISDNDVDIATLRFDLDSLSILGGAVLPSEIIYLQSQIDGISGIFDARVLQNSVDYTTLSNAITANTFLIQSVNADIIDNTNAIASLGSTVSTHTSNILELFSLVQSISANGGGGVISGGTGVIGPSEDGSYADGLFSDFTVNTPIGTAIDRINEVLKAIVPFPPSLGDMSFTAGESGKISYDFTHRSDGTYVVFAGKSVNSDISYSAGSSIGGIFDGNDSVSGTLANNINANADGSYPAKCFAYGNQGTLRLKVNGTDVHTADLSVVGAGSSVNGYGSGFVLQAASEAMFPNSAVGTGIYYRVGTWIVTAADLTPGYNYVQVVHDLGSSTPSTQIWKFLVDGKGASLPTLVGHTLTFTGGTTKKLSGVSYYTSGTFDYDATFNNTYPMTYSNSSISHPTSTYISSSSTAIPSVVTNENDTVVLNKTYDLSVGTRILNASALLSTTIPKTLGRSFTAGSLPVANILADVVNTASTNTVENFCNEGYRMYEGAGITTNTTYSGVTGGSPFTWNSNNNLASSGTNEYKGLLYYSGSLRHPTQGANSGNFNALINSPSPNANYSGMGTLGNLTFLRYFYFGGVLGLANFTIDIDSTGTSYGSTASGNTIKVEAMIPGTGTDYGTWFDCSVDENSNGIYASQFGNSVPGNWGISFPAGVNTSITKAILLKITAGSGWTGSITRISVSSN